MGTWWRLIARIGLKPQLEGLVRLLEVSGHLTVVVKVDEKPLAFADAIPQLPSFCGALSGQHGRSNIAVCEPQIRVRHRELGIDFDSTTEERYSRDVPGRCVHLHSGAVSLQ